MGVGAHFPNRITSGISVHALYLFTLSSDNIPTCKGPTYYTAVMLRLDRKQRWPYIQDPKKLHLTASPTYYVLLNELNALPIAEMTVEERLTDYSIFSIRLVQ